MPKTDNPEGIPASAQRGGDSLPCLNSNNSIEGHPNDLSTNHRKTAFCLEFNIRQLATKHGIERLGFLTLTFPQAVDRREMQRRWNSLASNYLRDRYGDYVAVVERGGKSGRLHFHLLVLCPVDIRTGFDFEAASRGDYQSANPALRGQWASLRKNLPKFGFGRHELLPVKSTTEGISKYVGKYIAKHVGQRMPEDKGLRLVRYSQGARSASNRFMFATKNSRKWRELVGAIALECGFTDLAEFKEHFGNSWARALQGVVQSGPDVEEPRGRIEHPRNHSDAVDRAWLPCEHQKLPEARAGYSARREWARRLHAASERAARTRFRRFIGPGPLSVLAELSKGRKAP